MTPAEIRAVELKAQGKRAEAKGKDVEVTAEEVVEEIAEEVAPEELPPEELIPEEMEELPPPLPPEALIEELPQEAVGKADKEIPACAGMTRDIRKNSAAETNFFEKEIPGTAMCLFLKSLDPEILLPYEISEEILNFPSSKIKGFPLWKKGIAREFNEWCENFPSKLRVIKDEEDEVVLSIDTPVCILKDIFERLKNQKTSKSNFLKEVFDNFFVAEIEFSVHAKKGVTIRATGKKAQFPDPVSGKEDYPDFSATVGGRHLLPAEFADALGPYLRNKLISLRSKWIENFTIGKFKQMAPLKFNIFRLLADSQAEEENADTEDVIREGKFFSQHTKFGRDDHKNFKQKIFTPCDSAAVGINVVRGADDEKSQIAVISRTDPSSDTTFVVAAECQGPDAHQSTTFSANYLAEMFSQNSAKIKNALDFEKMMEEVLDCTRFAGEGLDASIEKPLADFVILLVRKGKASIACYGSGPQVAFVPNDGKPVLYLPDMNFPKDYYFRDLKISAGGTFVVGTSGFFNNPKDFHNLLKEKDVKGTCDSMMKTAVEPENSQSFAVSLVRCPKS